MQLTDLTKQECDNLAAAIGYLEQIRGAALSAQSLIEYNNLIVGSQNINTLRDLALTLSALKELAEHQKEVQSKCKTRAEYEDAKLENRLADYLDRKGGGWL